MDAPGLSKLGELDNMAKLKDIIKKTAAPDKEVNGDEESENQDMGDPRVVMTRMLEHNNKEMIRFKHFSRKNLSYEFKRYIHKFKKSPIQSTTKQRSRKKVDRNDPDA